MAATNCFPFKVPPSQQGRDDPDTWDYRKLEETWV